MGYSNTLEVRFILIALGKNRGTCAIEIGEGSLFVEIMLWEVSSL